MLPLLPDGRKAVSASDDGSPNCRLVDANIRLYGGQNTCTCMAVRTPYLFTSHCGDHNHLAQQCWWPPDLLDPIEWHNCSVPVPCQCRPPPQSTAAMPLIHTQIIWVPTVQPTVLHYSSRQGEGEKLCFHWKDLIAAPAGQHCSGACGCTAPCCCYSPAANLRARGLHPPCCCCDALLPCIRGAISYLLRLCTLLLLILLSSKAAVPSAVFWGLSPHYCCCHCCPFRP
jgi:hypothetical protein